MKKFGLMAAVGMLLHSQSALAGTFVATSTQDSGAGGLFADSSANGSIGLTASNLPPGERREAAMTKLKRLSEKI